jgi:hypothetical protein
VTVGNESLWGAVPAFAAQMAAFEGLLLGASAVHKAVRWTHSLSVMRRFAGVPEALAAPALGAALALESAAAFMLLGARGGAAGGVLAALMFSLYAALIVRAVVAGRRDVDCGCNFGPASRPLGSFQIARNIVLAALAILIAGVPAYDGAVAGRVTLAVGGLALLALYGALDQVMSLRPLRAGELA